METTTIEPTPGSVDSVVFDVDGTLVDSVYAHVWIWHRVFEDMGVAVACSRLHRAIGMGGDRLVSEVAGAEVEERLGDTIRDHHDSAFDELLPVLRPTAGAVDLLRHLSETGVAVTLASSANRRHTTAMIELLGADRWIDAWVCGDDVESSKPAREPISLAVERVHGRHALVVGDSVRDIRAAAEAGQTGVGLLSGGVCEAELVAAGALAVHEDAAALRIALPTLLRAD